MITNTLEEIFLRRAVSLIFKITICEALAAVRGHRGGENNLGVFWDVGVRRDSSWQNHDEYSLIVLIYFLCSTEK